MGFEVVRGNGDRVLVARHGVIKLAVKLETDPKAGDHCRKAERIQPQDIGRNDTSNRQRDHVGDDGGEQDRLKNRTLEVFGPTGIPTIIERSPDLTTWLPLATNVYTINPGVFIDPAPPYPYRFYRAVQP